MILRFGPVLEFPSTCRLYIVTDANFLNTKNNLNKHTGYFFYIASGFTNNRWGRERREEKGRIRFLLQILSLSDICTYVYMGEWFPQLEQSRMAFVSIVAQSCREPFQRWNPYRKAKRKSQRIKKQIIDSVVEG